MAAVFNTDQVLDQVFDNEVACEEEDQVVIEEEDSEEDRLRECLVKYEPIKDEFDQEFFIAKSVEVLLPIVAQSTSETRSDASHLLSSTLSSASVLRNEAILWLSLIYKRLAGRVSVRQPYRAELRRNIPQQIFSEISLLLRRSASRAFKEPLCYLGKNRKGEVISFTCLHSLLKLFQLLTGKSSRQVRKYLSRQLKNPTRSGHPVKLLISESKDFALVYKYSNGQMAIQFSYGEWNTYGHPQHPCQMDDQEH